GKASTSRRGLHARRPVDPAEARAPAHGPPVGRVTGEVDRAPARAPMALRPVAGSVGQLVRVDAAPLRRDPHGGVGARLVGRSDRRGHRQARVARYGVLIGSPASRELVGVRVGHAVTCRWVVAGVGVQTWMPSRFACARARLPTSVRARALFGTLTVSTVLPSGQSVIAQPAPRCCRAESRWWPWPQLRGESVTSTSRWTLSEMTTYRGRLTFHDGR